MVVPNQTNTVTLAWDASADPSVVGYRIYQGPKTSTYTNVVDVGSALTGVMPLIAGTNYFAATAYATNGLESDYSAELVLPPKPIVVWIQTFVESSTNMVNWVSLTNFPTVWQTNPPSPTFWRTRVVVGP